MREPAKDYIPNDTTKFIDKCNTILYIFGMPKFWVGDVKLPKRVVKVFDSLFPAMLFVQWFFLSMQLGSIFFQKHLNPKQQSDAVILSVSNTTTHLYCLNCIFYRKESRQVIYYLFVALKELYNDKEVEQEMIKKLKSYLKMYACSSVMILGFYGVYALIEVIKTGAPFVTTVTAWPDVTDTSKIAGFARIVVYILWFISFYRMSMTFLLVLLMLTGLTNQYKNLQRYFENLNTIFENNQQSHSEKEMMFEKALARGIQSHSDTVWCAEQCQKIFSLVFAGNVVLALSILVVLIPVMMNSTHDVHETCNHLTVVVVTLVIMGFFMWNAGDVTVEAAKLPDCIYGSGWYNCYGKSSTRVRKLVVLAMTQAQKPIIFTALSVIELSYETYLAVIKTSYSVASVFY